MEVLMAPNRLMSSMCWKSWTELHSISAQSEIPALLTTAHRPKGWREEEQSNDLGEKGELYM